MDFDFVEANPGGCGALPLLMEADLQLAPIGAPVWNDAESGARELQRVMRDVFEGPEACK